VICIGNARDDMRKENTLRLLHGLDNVGCNVCHTIFSPPIGGEEIVRTQHLTRRGRGVQLLPETQR